MKQKLKTMRTTKELLELMLKHKDLFKTGLCFWALTLFARDVISKNEYDSLCEYITNNRPDYFSWTNYVKGYDKRGGYYFPSGEIKPRIYWIKTHIKRLS
jgi:hypothetical protein